MRIETRIDKISFKGMLPRVFLSEDIPFSDVWKGNLILERGACYLIEAASGGGKSSMCSYIYGVRNDYEGALFFNDENVCNLTVGEWQEVRRRHLAYLPQELSLFPELTAMENIELKNSLTGWKETEQIEEWLHVLGIDSRKNTRVGRMSVGQQQRVGIIRSLCQPFDFLLLDEPVSHLDENNNLKASTIILEEVGQQDAGLICTSVGNPLVLDESVRLKL